jgi:uncharacterized protein YndB with AHSA1/START domain
MTDTAERSQTHATFTIERDYPVAVEKVWHALTDDAKRRQWFGGDDAYEETERLHDFRVGGHSTQDGYWHDGPRSRFEATYTDIVEHERTVMTYDMWVDGRHLSTSVQTTTLEPIDGGTRLTLTEQAVHLDGLDSPAGREQGTAGLLDQLGDHLAR